MYWCEECAAFSEAWMDVCHWVSPKKFRETLTDEIGATWVRVDAVPAALDKPPVDLRVYKTSESQQPVRPCLCPVCDVACNSLAQYRAHAKGRVHHRQARRWERQNRGKSVEPVLLDGAADAVPPRVAMERRALQRREAAASAADDASAEATSGLSADGSSAALTPRSAPLCVPRRDSGFTAASDAAAFLPSSPHGTQGGCTRYEPYDLTLDCGTSDSDVETSLGSLSGIGHPIACARARGAVEHVLLRGLDVVLAGGLCNGAAYCKALALASSVVHVAGEQVVDALIGAAADRDAEPVGALAAALSEVYEGGLSSALLRRAVPAAACDEEGEARERRRLRGLVRLVAVLVRCDVLPVAILVRCVGAALKNAGAEDVVAAFEAVTCDTTAERFNGWAACTVQAQFARALASKRFPSYVRAMVAPLVEA